MSSTVVRHCGPFCWPENRPIFGPAQGYAVGTQIATTVDDVSVSRKKGLLTSSTVVVVRPCGAPFLCLDRALPSF